MNHKNHLRLRRSLSAVLALMIVLLTGCANQAADTSSVFVPAGTSTPTTNATIRPSSSTVTEPTTAATQPTTAPTQPATEPTQPTEPEPKPFPEELANNVFLTYVDSGFCEELTGDVMVTIVFLSDSISIWDSASIAAAKEQFDQELSKLESGAEAYGAELNVEITYLESKILQAYDPGDQFLLWAKAALDKHKLGQGIYDSAYLENHYQADSAPVVFVLNRDGRAYAAPSAEDSAFEYVVMYRSALTAIRHELCHVYGAMDFYFPQEVVEASKLYLPNSLMIDSINGTMDDLTAYLIGWADTLLPNAEAFLRATNHITKEQLEQDNQDNMMTGYGTKRFNGCTYTGYMVAGVPHGEGICVWDVGVVYTGNWSNGLRCGYGEQTEANGAVYKGEWENDVMQGQGTLYYPDGKQVYTGEFQNGRRHGQGTHTFANGDVYTGEWKNGAFDGQGTYNWVNGATYTGAWVNGRRTGYGVLKYADGSRYEGEFKNDCRHGQGTYYDANGNATTGIWKNDVLTERI